jgi:hypothetical protein
MPYVKADDYAQLANQGREIAVLREQFDRALAQLKREDKGWTSYLGVEEGENFGLTLEDLQKVSKKLRESVVGAPWMGRGLRLRASNVWQEDGMQYSGIPEAARGKKNVQDLMDHPQNQLHFFGHGARREREGCLYHDGISIWIGDDKTKLLEAIPLTQIKSQLVDPNGLGVIWAYKREWSELDLSTGKREDKKEWIFVDRFIDKRVTQIKVGDNEPEKVNMTARIFDMHANHMRGLPYGTPDALAAFIWNGIARDLYMDGVTMSEAMATFAFKAKVTTKEGAKNAAMAYATEQTAGSTAIVGGPNDLQPMSNAGKAYDFESIRAITAIIAAALDVSNIHLTADPGAAGSSYGSAQTLDLPTRLAMEARRQEHIDLDRRVLTWMGAKDAEPYFKSLADPTEIFREVQALLLLWSSGLYSPAPLEKRISELMQILENTVPDGVLIPNNSASWERTDIDPKDDPDAEPTDASSVGKPNATPAGQGQNSPAGQGVGSDDIRQRESYERMMAAIERFEAMESRIQLARAA